VFGSVLIFLVKQFQQHSYKSLFASTSFNSCEEKGEAKRKLLNTALIMNIGKGGE
jgi:hypothetical protein